MKYLDQMQDTARRMEHDLRETGKKVWLAGLGTVGMIGNTTGTLFDTLVDEGKRFQEGQVKVVDKVMTRTTDRVSTVMHDAMTYVQDAVQDVTKTTMNRLGMPSRKDVADLTARVELLTAKVEMLSKKGAGHVN